MKNKIIIFLILLFTNLTYSQTNKIQDTSVIISVISTNRDTLYLSDTQIGHVIYKSWDDVPKDKKPVIIFKNHSWILERRFKQK